MLPDFTEDWIESDEKQNMVLDNVRQLDGTSLTDLYKATPFVLRLTDHYSPSTKLLGLKGIDHLINNFSLSDLREANFDGLFYQTLKNMLYSDDIVINQLLVPTVIRFIQRFDYDHSELEQVFALLIRNTSLTSNLKLKSLYLFFLRDIAKLLDKRMKKFTNELLPLISNSLEEDINCDSVDVMSKACQLFLCLLRFTGDMSGLYFHQMMVTFLKVRIKLEDLSDEKRTELSGVIENIRTCQSQLAKLNFNQLKEMKDFFSKNLSSYSLDYEKLQKILEEEKC